MGWGGPEGALRGSVALPSPWPSLPISPLGQRPGRWRPCLLSLALPPGGGRHLLAQRPWRGLPCAASGVMVVEASVGADLLISFLGACLAPAPGSFFPGCPIGSLVSGRPLSR